MKHYDLVRPLLVDVGDKPLAQAVAALDTALEHAARAGAAIMQPRQRRTDAETAFRRELYDATLARRAPTLDWSAVAAADEYDAELAARRDVADLVVGHRAAELDVAVGNARRALFDKFLPTWSRWILEADPDDEMPADLRAQSLAFRWPGEAWTLGHLDNREGLHPWPLWDYDTRLHSNERIAQARYSFERSRHEHNVHRRYRWTDDGTIMYPATWTPDPGLARGGPVFPVVVVGDLSGERRDQPMPGDVVFIGTGPDGEEGIDPAEWQPPYFGLASAGASGGRGTVDYGPLASYPGRGPR